MKMGASARGISWKLSLLVLVDAALLFGLGKAIISQKTAAEEWVNVIADLRDPSPFRVALRGHLDKMLLSVHSYVYTRDSALLNPVPVSEQEFERSVPDFEKQDPRLFPPAASAEILQAYHQLKDSVDWTVKATGQRAERWNAAESIFAQMLNLIDLRLQPLCREGMPNAAARRDALLNFENQLRARQQALTQSWSDLTAASASIDSEFENRGSTFLDLYDKIVENPRERTLLKRLRNLWDQTAGQISDSRALADVQTQALDHMNADRERVEGILNRYLPAMRREDLDARKLGMMHSLRGHIALAGLLALVGIGLIAGSALAAYRIVRPRPKPKIIPTEAAPEEPTLQINLKGAISAWTDAAEHLYGYSAWEIQGKSLAKLFAAESELKRLSKLFGASKDAHVDTIHLTKEGTAFPVRIEFRELTDESGHPTGIGLLCHRR